MDFIKFLFYILMKKKEEPKIEEEMENILKENDYKSYKEWKDSNGSI